MQMMNLKQHLDVIFILAKKNTLKYQLKIGNIILTWKLADFLDIADLN